MPKEWIDPRYAEIVAAMKRAQRWESREPKDRPVRGFVIPPKG